MDTINRYLGNYLGICVNNQDPQRRGRVQIFVPGILPAVLPSWKTTTTIERKRFIRLGMNEPLNLSNDDLLYLRESLPWAEAALPILGPCTASSLLINKNDRGNQPSFSSPVDDLTSENFSNNAFYRDPWLSTSHVEVNLNNITDQAATNLRNQGKENRVNYRGQSQGLCGVGTRGILSVLFQDPWFARTPLGAFGGNSNAASLVPQNNKSLNPYLLQSGYFDRPQYIGNLQQTIQHFKTNPPPVGTVVVSSGNHIQVWTGSRWVSDFVQKSLIAGTAGSEQMYAYFPKIKARISDQPIVGISNSGQITTPVALLHPSNSKQFEQSQTQATTTSSEIQNLPLQSIHSLRKNAAQELQQNTNTLAALYAVMQYEVGGKDLATQTAFVETVLNRSVLTKQPLSQLLNQTNLNYSRRYWEIQRKNPEAFLKTQEQIANHLRNGQAWSGSQIATQAIIQALRGSNFAGGATHNATLSYMRQNPGAFNIDPISEQNLRDPNYAFKEAFYYKKNESAQIQQINQMLAQNRSSQFIEKEQAIQQFNNVNYIHTTNPHGPIVGQGWNDISRGVFTFPSPGALLWVFFQAGDPLYPVYFASSYTASQWRSVHDSDGTRGAHSPWLTYPQSSSTT